MGARFQGSDRETKRMGLIIVLLLSMGCLVGCHDRFAYRYADIQMQYMDTICDLGPLETQAASGNACALDQEITLAEAIAIARANNPDIRMAVARVHQAEAKLAQAEAAFYPMVGVYGEYTHADAPSVYLFKKIDQRELAPNTDFNDPGEIRNVESGVRVNMNLFNGGRDDLVRKMAETDVTISQSDRRQVENAVMATVIRAYYDIMAAREFIRIAEESVRTVKTQLDIMNVRYRGGGALKSDILSLEVRLAEAMEDEVRSRNRYQMAKTALAQILGVNPDRDIQLVGSDPKIPDIPKRYIDGLNYAVAHRPDLRKVRNQVRQGKMALDMARAGFLPRVDFQARYYLDDENAGFDIQRDNWMAGLMINWELFSGFATRAQVQAASHRMVQVLAADRKALLAAKSEVKNAYLKLEEAQARLDVAKKSVVSAVESLELVRKQYEGGAVGITRYLEAELDRNRAKVRETAARYDRQKAIAEIGRAIGLWADRAAIDSRGRDGQ